MVDSGEMTCVLCGGTADQVGRFCTSCVGYQGPSSAPRWARPLTLAPARLGLLRALRWPLVAFLFVGVGLAGARAAESWVATRQLGHVTGAGSALLHTHRVQAIVHLERQLGLLQVGATVAIGAIFLVWWALAYRNLPAMGIRTHSRPSWAVLSWFVPIVGFFTPRRVAEELWWGSDAGTPFGWSYGPGAVSGLVSGWWGCWLSSIALPALAVAAVQGVAAFAPDRVATVAVLTGVAFLLSAVLLAIAGLCAACLVMAVTAGQVQRAEAIEAAGLVPLP